MALAVSFRAPSCRLQRAPRRCCVKVAAVHPTGKASVLAASVTAAALLLSSPVVASPLLNPVAELGVDPVGKVLNKLDSLDPPRGVKGPEVEGQFRSNPDKARALAAENSPAGSPEAEARGSATCPCTGLDECPCGTMAQ